MKSEIEDAKSASVYGAAEGGPTPSRRTVRGDEEPVNNSPGFPVEGFTRVASDLRPSAHKIDHSHDGAAKTWKPRGRS